MSGYALCDNRRGNAGITGVGPGIPGRRAVSSVGNRITGPCPDAALGFTFQTEFHTSGLGHAPISPTQLARWPGAMAMQVNEIVEFVMEYRQAAANIGLEVML